MKKVSWKKPGQVSRAKPSMPHNEEHVSAFDSPQNKL
jgi:hypothetical protein